VSEPDESTATKLYASLAHDELVAKCVQKDRTIRSLRAQLEAATSRARHLEERMAIGRARI
jgi:hypothetical protein